MAIDYSALYPVIILVGFAAALPAVHLFAKSSRDAGRRVAGGHRRHHGPRAHQLHDRTATRAIMGGENTPLLQLDVFAALFALVFLSVAFYVVLASARFVEKDQHQAEYYSLIMLATAGMMVVAMSMDLITLFVGLEVASISTFALVAFRKKDKRGAEAATKYFIIGGLSSALSLYGISLLYGVTGTTNFEGINTALAAMPSGLNAGHPAGHRPGDRRLRLQGGHRARSTCGLPMCTKGRRPPISGLAGRQLQEDGHGPAVQALPGWPDSPSRRTGRRGGHTRHPDHDRGQRHRLAADQHQADAGLLVHRPGGLHDHRHSGGYPVRAWKAASSTS